MSAKKEIRNSIARFLYMAGITSPAQRGRNRLSIVTFHRVLPEAERQVYPFPGLAVTPEELDAFLTYFTANFDCGALGSQHERYLSRKIPTTRPLLAITFDDGQYDNFLHARPVLARHQLKASFFVPVVAVEQQELLWHDRLGFAVVAMLKQANIGKSKLQKILSEFGIPANDSPNLLRNAIQASKKLPLKQRLRLVNGLVDTCGASQIPSYARLMTFKEIAELSADGHEIGSHSMTHCMMTECDDQALLYEIGESRHILQSRLGQPIETFCYPNGNSDTRTAHAVAKAGYRRAVTTNWGNNGPETDCFRLCRYDMNAKYVQGTKGEFIPALLAFRMSGYYPGLK